MSIEIVPDNIHHFGHCMCGMNFSAISAKLLCDSYLEHVKTCPWHLERAPKEIPATKSLILSEVTLECSETRLPEVIFIFIGHIAAEISHDEASRLIVWLGEVLERHGGDHVA